MNRRDLLKALAGVPLAQAATVSVVSDQGHVVSTSQIQQVRAEPKTLILDPKHVLINGFSVIQDTQGQKFHMALNALPIPKPEDRIELTIPEAGLPINTAYSARYLVGIVRTVETFAKRPGVIVVKLSGDVVEWK